jgi:hypothetical protein
MNTKSYLLSIATLCFCWILQAQPPCPEVGDRSLIIEIQTDQYPWETGWSVEDADGNVYAEVGFSTYEANTLYQRQVCVPDSTCILFTLLDQFGDGIFSPGFYNVILEGDTLASGGPEFDEILTVQFGCEVGQLCETAQPVGEGQYTAPYDDTWYAFSPDSVGIYQITTCGLNDCNTKIWVYDTCEGITVAEDNQSTIFFNDDESECAPQAVVESFFDPEQTYYIRIGDHMDACADSIVWEIVYLGPVIGCTDPASCNYNPLATIDDGSCLPLGDPDCPNMPDLLIREDILSSSIYLSTIESTDPCLIEEGCLHGYGQRDIVRFTTQIDNIGELDYYIGQPATGNSQFTWDNCHNHFHYDGYAEYVLFTEEGVEIPIGFKNGFCVIDLGCDTGSPQYGCGNMGISAGCYDFYSSSLECQWIDVTDVPDGRYTFVTRVNWDFAPDNLGRLERDSMNNWAQVCILLDRSSGELEMSLDDSCDPYVDCAGVLYGDTQVDCTGECGGTVVRGDLDANGTQEIVDAQQYVSGILGNDLSPTSCNDLNADDKITVYDAALLASCMNYGESHPHEGSGAHDHCNFPSGVLNTTDTVSFSIIDANFEEQYIDIGMYNPTTRVNAYQFVVEGLFITTVENLVPESEYPIAPLGIGNQIVGISYQDSMVYKRSEMQPLCRIHYASLTDDFICLTDVVDVVNQDHEQTVGLIEEACVEFVPNSTFSPESPLNCRLFPNPLKQTTRLVFSNPNQAAFQLDIMSVDGRVLKSYANIRSDELQIDASDLASGLYVYRLQGEAGTAVGRMIVEQ